jgi:hypothetical protein
MLGYKGPAQPSPVLGDALNAGYNYLEVRCLGCDTHQTVALDRAATSSRQDAYRSISRARSRGVFDPGAFRLVLCTLETALCRSNLPWFLKMPREGNWE